MLIRAPAVGFKVVNGRVDARDFEKWARETQAVASDGSAFATDAEAAALASAAQAAAIASSLASATTLASAAQAAAIASAAASLAAITTTNVPEGTNQYHTGSRARAACRLWTVRSVSSTTTVSSTDDVVAVDATSGPLTVNLPTLASNTNLRVVIKKADGSANAVTVDGNGSEQIDGATTFVLSAAYQSVMIVAGPTRWLTI